MKLILTKAFLLLIVISTFSCKEKDHWKSEVIAMLNQQNKVGFDANRRMEGNLYNLMYNSYNADRFEYLQPSAKKFFESVDHFSNAVSNAILLPNKDSLAYLFANYQRLQNARKFCSKRSWIACLIPNSATQLQISLILTEQHLPKNI